MGLLLFWTLTFSIERGWEGEPEWVELEELEGGGWKVERLTWRGALSGRYEWRKRNNKKRGEERRKDGRQSRRGEEKRWRAVEIVHNNSTPPVRRSYPYLDQDRTGLRGEGPFVSLFLPRRRRLFFLSQAEKVCLLSQGGVGGGGCVLEAARSA